MMIDHLYKIFEHWGNEIYCISDTHFSDYESFMLRKNARTLPDSVNSLVEYDNFLVKSINSTCGKNSTLIILGDVGNINCIKQLRARCKVLIKGNHDSGSTNYKREINEIKTFSEIPAEEREKIVNKAVAIMNDPEKIKDMSPAGCFRIKKEDNHLFDEVYEGPLFISKKILLTHEPVDFQFAFNIHGHDHSNRSYKDCKHLNVCCEHVNYKPVSLNRLIKEGTFGKIEDIHRHAIDDQAAKARARKQKQSY